MHCVVVNWNICDTFNTQYNPKIKWKDLRSTLQLNIINNLVVRIERFGWSRMEFLLCISANSTDYRSVVLSLRLTFDSFQSVSEFEDKPAIHFARRSVSFASVTIKESKFSIPALYNGMPLITCATCISCLKNHLFIHT